MPGRSGQRYDRSDSDPPVQAFSLLRAAPVLHERLLRKSLLGSGVSGGQAVRPHRATAAPTGPFITLRIPNSVLRSSFPFSIPRSAL